MAFGLPPHRCVPSRCASMHLLANQAEGEANLAARRGPHSRGTMTLSGSARAVEAIPSSGTCHAAEQTCRSCGPTTPLMIWMTSSRRPPPTPPSRTDRVRKLCLVRLDKTRPALMLTPDAARGAMTKVTSCPDHHHGQGPLERGPGRARERAGPGLRGLPQQCPHRPGDHAGPHRRAPFPPNRKRTSHEPWSWHTTSRSPSSNSRTHTPDRRR